MPDVQITQTRSLIGCTRQQRRTLQSLGLRRIRATVTLPDRPEIRGMISKVAHLVDVAYAGDGAGEPGEVLDLEPGQRPKGRGNPPAGPSVADDEAAQAAQEAEDALAEPGSVDSAADVVQRTPATPSPGRTERPKPAGSPFDPDADADESDASTDDTQVMEIVDPDIDVSGNQE